MIAYAPSERFNIPVSFWVASRKLPANPFKKRETGIRQDLYKCWFADEPVDEGDLLMIVDYCNQTYHAGLLNRLLSIRSEWSKKV